MKDKMLYLILGILIGAVITSAIFLVFVKNDKPGDMGDRGGRMQDGNFVPPSMSNSNTIDGNTVPPDKPSDVPSDKPSGDSNQNTVQ